jgi:serine/threonine protein kinase
MARLLDGGTTPDGLPWLVMEYVDGVPLYQWCSERAPELRERLRLFLGLCSAVEAAHHRLILHRDIKPANVLVTPDGTPRLLDFGVAKIFSRDGIVSEVELTTLRAPLTPEYASPEQLRGEEVTTSTDVYSLGVLLYELTTGVRPYPTRAEGAAELVRSVLEKDPVRPSTAAGGAGTAAAVATAGTERVPFTGTLPSPPTGGSGHLSRALAGDLDNIVLKALSKETIRRYGSVEELAADLKRHLDGRPVDARPSTWAYRTSKFVRRNRVAVTMSAVALAAILVGAVFSLWSAAEARKDRARAERRLRDVAAMANTVLWDVSEELSKIPGTTPSREKVIDTATRYLNGIAQEGVRDTALVRTLADAFDKLGTVQGQAWSANVGRS